ncbi:MAG: Cof-type HAD-IIB family hydrolase [Candidatus Gastranaerophilaceae bacterium]|nr:Cof-type HAD-IIB family hydrolase [Candidatus Gastranaerophilaceae bacterium]
MIKMVATDIDGTILNWDFEFSPEVIECVKKLTKNGIKVVLVTGRMHRAALKLAQKLELETPIVSYQGGLIKEQSGKTLYEKTMDVNRAKEVIKWAKENNVHINLYMDDVLYVENDNIAVKRYTGERYIPYEVCNFDGLEIKNVNKILAIDFDDAEKVTGWVNYLRQKMPELYIVKSTPYFCEISNPEAKKSCAVEFLSNYYGIKKEEILTIGDQNNDIELLKSGGVAVAMGNATDELKKYADFVTDTIDNNGFVKAVEKFVF